MDQDSAPESAPARVAGSISPVVADEQLSPVEGNYLRLAKADADRALAEALGFIIRAHGHDQGDGRRYNFVDDDHGRLSLRISAA